MNLRRLRTRALLVLISSAASLTTATPAVARTSTCLICAEMEECPDWSTRDHMCFHAYGTYALSGCMAAACDFDEQGWQCSC